MTRGRDWNTQWQPSSGRPMGARPLRFGTDDHPQVVELQGAFKLPPIPPDYQPPPPPGSLQRMLIEEPSDGWWRQAGAFGFRYQGLVPASAGVELPVLEQLNLPGPPAPWWVHLYRSDRGLPAGEESGNYAFRARIIYGVGGIQNVLEVDWLQGVQFPIVCNSISIQAISYNSIDNGEPYESSGDSVVLGTMLGKGAAGVGIPPTYTTPAQFNAAGPGVTADFPIPDLARRMSVYTDVFPSQPNYATIGVGFRGGAANTVAFYSGDPDLGGTNLLLSSQGVPIPNHAKTARIDSPALPVSTNIGLIFHLAL
jgi:hypothetical protein